MGLDALDLHLTCSFIATSETERWHDDFVRTDILKQCECPEPPGIRIATRIISWHGLNFFDSVLGCGQKRGVRYFAG